MLFSGSVLYIALAYNVYASIRMRCTNVLDMKPRDIYVIDISLIISIIYHVLNKYRTLRLYRVERYEKDSEYDAF